MDKNENDRIKLSGKIGMIRNGKMTKDQEKLYDKLKKRNTADGLAGKKAYPGVYKDNPPKIKATEEAEQIDELSKEKLKSYVKAKKAAIPYQAKDKEIEKAEKKISKMNENNEPKVSVDTEMSRMRAVESVARSIMSQKRDLRHEAIISDFESRNHQADNNKGE